jgi:Family of unknown function (DUF6104)
VNLHPEFETAVDRLATFLARDDEEDLLSQTSVVSPVQPRFPASALGRHRDTS